MYTIFDEEGGCLAMLDTYMAVVYGSIGTKQYRKLFVKRKGQNKCEDVIGDGDLACAFYVSSVLHMMGLIQRGVHTTVKFTEIDLCASGWEEIEKPMSGSIVVWGERMGTDGVAHRHIGICLNDKEAVSNCSMSRSPRKHGIYDLHGEDRNFKRKVEKFYHHRLLKC